MEASEQDRIDYQTKTSETRHRDLMFKHFKRMSKETSLPSTVALNGQESRTVKETLNLFNEYYQSVYLPKNEILSDICCNEPKLTNFDTSFLTIQKFIQDWTKPNLEAPMAFRHFSSKSCVGR